MITTSTAVFTVPFVDVRCHHCDKLGFRWLFKGTASIEIRCTRCKKIQVFNLST